MMRFALCALALCCAPAHAQSAGIPRTADGHPDFHGVWSTKWRTPLERQKEADGAAVVPADKMRALVEALDAGLVSSGNLSPDVDFDWGPFVPATGGGFRTSMIVDPPDGKRPFTQMAKDLTPRLKVATDKAEGPEVRTPSERCLHGSGTTPLNISPGNQNHQIVQTPGAIVLYTEDISDVRIIRMGAAPRPDALESWPGDSIGHWEDDTLVIETRLLRPEPNNPSPASGQPRRKVTERLSFKTAEEISYDYTVEDPLFYVAPMHVEFPMVRTPERMFEVACHEANYSLAGILSGARAMEARAAKPVKTTKKPKR